MDEISPTPPTATTAKQWTTQDKIAEGERLKDAGNAFVKAGELKKALRSYKTVFLYVNGLIARDDQAMARFAGGDVLTEDDSQRIKELKTNTQSNIALCYERLRQFDSVVKHCNEAIKLSPLHVKSLVRLGNAQLELGKLDLAKPVLLKAYELEPGNAAVQQAINRLKAETHKATATQREKDKQAFGGKFL